MGYFMVIAKCGHVGRNNYILKTFYLEASNKKEAAKIIKETPRVKHNQKDVIKDVFEITSFQYSLGLQDLKHDSYFHVSNKQDQNRLCPNINECVLKEEKGKTFRKKRSFNFAKYELLVKEKNKEIRDGYLL